MKNPEEWKVYFHGNFWGHHGDEPAGEERRLNAHFSWGEQEWYVPAVYVCASGLVLDLCARVEAETIRVFLEKWNVDTNTRESQFTEEELEQIRLENPLNLDIKPTLLCNGKLLRAKSSSGFGYNPCLNGGLDEEPACKRVLEHYGLDPACGWGICRVCFGWDKPEVIERLELNMIQQPVEIPGPRFTAQAGEQIGFTHPVTGAQHCIVVHELERQSLEQARFGDDEREYPNHFILMDYTVAPPLPPQAMSILDCEPSDSPKGEKGAVSVGVIGSAHGPAVLERPDQKTHREACSSMHFAPQEKVLWRIVFHEKLLEDQTFILIENA